jgi:hypothetical protein
VIGKTRTGKGFANTLNYCLRQDKNAEILDLNGLSTDNPKDLAQEFQVIWEENQNISKPVWHTSLSFHEKDNITNEKMKEIANKFMQSAGFEKDNYQYVIIKHNDTKHNHCHIVANRVGFDGKAVSDYYSKTRTVSLSKKIEKEYNLTIAQEIAKEHRLAKEQRLENEIDPVKNKIKEEIKTSINKPGLESLQDLSFELKKKGIDLQVLKYSKTGKEYGVVFKMGNSVFKGSDLGKQFAFKALSENLNPKLKLIKTVVKVISKGIEMSI